MNEALKKPMQPHEIEWRISSSRNGKTTVVPYLQNRAVMERFDEAFKPNCWSNTFEHLPAVPILDRLNKDDKELTIVGYRRSVKCGISVLCNDGEWVTKFDGADESDIEATKGGFSDSMKRCAVQWGLGRDLYKYPRVFIEGEHKFIPDWANEMLDKLVEAYIAGKLEGRSVITLKQKT